MMLHNLVHDYASAVVVGKGGGCEPCLRGGGGVVVGFFDLPLTAWDPTSFALMSTNPL